MRRVAAILLVAAALGGFALIAGGAGDEPAATTFKVELDNAFGITVGGDFKVAGVRAGKVDALDLDRRTRRAIVSFTITEDGFGSLRTDTTCAVQPQSLIGEYYVDCDPGTARTKLRPGATIPVERTQGTIPPDLVNNIMRRPYRERLSIIVAELGAGVAGNAQNLDAALRRANPALRETNKVLALLARQNRVLADLTRDADAVVTDLADNRDEVGRWVTEARDTARASAARDDELAAGFRRLPAFLRELQPTMRELGATADAQTPALRNLARSAGQLERLLRNVPPFAAASRPALAALATTAKTGRGAVASATPTVAELDRYAKGAPELATNLAIVLEHLDDRANAAETDPRSPGGQGYTGLEALLQYVYDQAQATNVHDGNVHILKSVPFEGQCAAYADLAAAKEKADACSTALGPNVIGLTFPDATAPAGYDGRDRGGSQERVGLPIPARRTGPRTPRRGDEQRPGDEQRRGDGGGSQSAPAPRDDAAPARPSQPALPALPAVPVPDLDHLLPVPATPPGGASPDQTQQDLLDFLLGS
jgi:virulence factor Mce-like protein